MSDVDRISNLPDELLLHVMFFLALHEAVQTCVLSRRWKDLWASLMWLNFNAEKFSSMKTFKKFVDNILQYRESLPVRVPLDAFFIYAVCDNSDEYLDYSDIHPWNRHALESNAYALGLVKHCGPILSIQGYDPFPFTSVHLKLLVLFHFSVDDSFVDNLSSYCPVLENLELRNCAINVTVFSSPVLKSLIITSTHNYDDYPTEFMHLVIHMPNLGSLYLEEIPRRNIHLMDVSSLETATIFLYSLSFKDSNVHCNILSSLSNTTMVNLVSASVFEDVVPKVLLHDLPRCETFHNLTHLHLGEWFLTHGCYPLMYLLRRSPIIEKIILQLIKSGSDDYDDHIRFPHALAEICPLSEVTRSKISCEKLREIQVWSPPGDKRVNPCQYLIHLS